MDAPGVDDEGCRGPIRVQWLCRTANKLVHRLGPEEKRALAAILHEPIPFGRCKPVKDLANLGVRRFDFTESCRGTIVCLPRGACLIHVGTHSAADRFARFYRGTLSNHLIPLEVSEIMKIPVRKTKDGTTVPPEAPATAGPTPAAYPELKMADALALAESIHRMAARAGEPDRNALLGMVTGIESRVAGFEAELTKSGQSFVDLSRHLDEQAARLAGIEEEFASRLGRVAATVGARLDESLARARETRDSIETANAGTAARIDGLESREEEVARRFDKLADDIGRLAGRLDDIDLERRPIEEEVGRLARAVDSLGRLNETLAATAAAGQAALRSRIETSDTGLSGLGGIVEALAARVEALESRKAHPVRAWVFSRLPRVNSWLSGLRA